MVRDCRIESRSRRQLIVRIDDGSGELLLRFLHFYPSHQKTLAAGQRVRVRGEVRGGFFGREMVHPVFRGVAPDTPLAAALTPIYPTSASLPQPYLSKAIDGALQRADLSEIVPRRAAAGRPAEPARQPAVAAPSAAGCGAACAGGSRPAGLAAAEVRRAAGAADLAAPGPARTRAAAGAALRAGARRAARTVAGRAAVRADGGSAPRGR